jgi:outer membrane receptor for ferrienterochelin and colicin
MIGFDFLRNNANFGAFTDPATGIPLPHSRPSKKAIVNGAGYIQEEAKLLDRFNLTPVIRWDYHSEFGSTFSPKLGVSSLLIDELRFHASAGRSFRAPSLAEMYLPDFPVTPGVKLKPNSNLKPEYIWGFDAGFDFDPVHALAVKIRAFYNSMDNLINQTIVSNPTVCVTHRNIAKATSEGIEAELQWRPLKAISLAAHATLQDSWDKSYKAPLDYVPKKMAGSSMRFSDTVASKKMEGQIVVNYVGKRSYLDFQHSEDAEIISTLEGLKYIPRSRPLPSYYTIDVSYRIFLLKRLCLHLAVQNLLNAEYKEAPGNLAPGILPTIKAGYDF